MLFTISHLADGSFVSFISVKDLDRRDGDITEHIIAILLLFEVVGDLALGLLELFVLDTAGSLIRVLSIRLFRSQVPKMYLPVEVTGC